jgi:ketosteroid isomerase-like protein
MNGKVLAVLLVVLLAVPLRGDEAGEVRKALEALNQAFEKRNADAIRALMTDDHVAVTSYYGGPQTRDEQLKGLLEQKLEEYRATDLKVRMLGKETALVTYELAQRGTYKGKALPARSFASAVWVWRGGKWLEAFYQETALPAK